MISLESRGVLTNKFHKPFRRKPLWSVDWSDYEPIEGSNSQSLSDLGSMSKLKKAESSESLSEKHEKEAD